MTKKNRADDKKFLKEQTIGMSLDALATTLEFYIDPHQSVQARDMTPGLEIAIREAAFRLRVCSLRRDADARMIRKLGGDTED